MDASVSDELLQREARNFAPNRIEARDDDGVRGIINDDVDPCGELEGANVSALATDDASLHLIVRKRHG